MEHYYSLFSGGFDSTLASFKAVAENAPLRLTLVFFDYGQRSKEEEAKAAMQLLPHIREFAGNRDKNTVVDGRLRSIRVEGLFAWSQSSILEGGSEEGDAGLENRNLVLLSCLSSIIMADRRKPHHSKRACIVTGFTGTYYDTSLQFRDAINAFFNTTGQKIAVKTPLIPEGHKGEVDLAALIETARALGILPLLDEQAWSCYFPQGGASCGTCDPCMKRRRIAEAVRRHCSDRGAVGL